MLSFTERIEDVSRKEWESVLARSLRPSPFLSPRFLIPWAKSFAAGLPLRIFRWEKDGSAECFLFLCGLPGGEGWGLMGGEDVSDSLDAVAAAGKEEEFWREFLDSAGEMLGRGRLRMPNLVEGSRTLSLLPRICRESETEFHLEEIDRAPFLPLPKSFGEYIEGLGKKERHELRRKIRRAAESDPSLSFRVTKTREELERDILSFLALHRLSGPGKKKFMDSRMEGFFREMAEEFQSAGMLRLAFLRGANGDVASAFQIESGGVLRLYNSGFDPAAARMSPGLSLLARCIEDAVGRGIAEYDFLRGRERYKYDLGARDRRVYRATLVFR